MDQTWAVRLGVSAACVAAYPETLPTLWPPGGAACYRRLSWSPSTSRRLASAAAATLPGCGCVLVWALGLAQIPFIINFFWSIRNGEKVNSDNPWEATTLEWQTPTPPPHGNFPDPSVTKTYRDAYEYSHPDNPNGSDYWPQNEPTKA